MWKIYLLEAAIVIIVSVLWVIGIDKMTHEHPDYKGEDFLDLDWDDNEDYITKYIQLWIQFYIC
jgi:hypothetical protein